MKSIPSELERFVGEAQTCSYLPATEMTLEWRMIAAIQDDEYEGLLSLGWRRTGFAFFRPACQHCGECMSLRVPTAEFVMSKSQRRIWRENADIEVRIGAPTVSEAHLELYNAYHMAMELKRGWRYRVYDTTTYRRRFVVGAYGFGREFLYYQGDRLIGVGLVDVLPNALSSVYFFHDPGLRDLGLGVFSLLTELEYARSQGISHAYLGYWVENCPSMNYKATYRPHELLRTRPADHERPLWNN